MKKNFTIGKKGVIEVFNDIFLVDLGVYLKRFKVLIIADLHIGLEEALNKQGFLIPRFQFGDLIKRVSSIFKILENGGFKVEKIVINGDLKHEFGTISEQEWKHTLRMIDFLKRHCKEVVLVKGNHDTIIGPIANKSSVRIVDYLIFGSVLIVHGHKIPNIAYNKDVKTVIIAHEHPAVSLREGLRVEVFKVFLVGYWNKRRIIVMPSLNLVKEGSDILREKLLSPFLRQVSLNDFNVFVVGDKIYYFGSVERLLKLED